MLNWTVIVLESLVTYAMLIVLSCWTKQPFSVLLFHSTIQIMGQNCQCVDSVSDTMCDNKYRQYHKLQNYVYCMWSISFNARMVTSQDLCFDESSDYDLWHKVCCPATDFIQIVILLKWWIVLLLPSYTPT